MSRCGRSTLAPDILTITDLSAGYGKLTVLHNAGLGIPDGGFTAILGPNGSGKSTLLKSIFGLTHIATGDIRFQDRSLIGLSTEHIGRYGIAYVPQRENIFTSMTVQENLRLALRKLPHSQAEEAVAEAYRLFPILAKRPRQKAGQLSGGERQMLAIALGWLARPRLMLLDEPSAGLAPLYVAEVFRTLRRLCDQGITLAVVEQNARSVLQWCDYACVLREGSVVFRGTAQQLLADEDAARRYLGVRAGNNPAAPAG